MRNLFRGELVRLTSEPLEELAKLDVVWQRDTELNRLADDAPAMLWSVKKSVERLRERIEKVSEDYFFFSIRTLEADKLIGVTMLRVTWFNADAIAGIMIGDRDLWGKGYGTDAMRLLLQYAFMELNLRRVTLGVNAFNARAIRSYEKAGFVREGLVRGEMLREGRRADSVLMGVLREEWLTLQGDQR